MQQEIANTFIYYYFYRQLFVNNVLLFMMSHELCHPIIGFSTVKNRCEN